MLELEELESSERPLTDLVSSFLPKKQWRQAQQIFNANQCVIVHSDPLSVLALVRDTTIRGGTVRVRAAHGNRSPSKESGIHRVAIEFATIYGRLELTLGCDCKAFEQTDLCPHLGVMAMAVDAFGITDQLPIAESNDASAMDVYDVAELFARHRIQLDKFEAMLAAVNGSPSGNGRPPSAWQRKLNLLKRNIDIATSDSTEGRSRKRSKPRQHLVGVDLATTTRLKKLVLSLFYRERLKGGQWGALREVRSTRQDLLADCSPAERQTFEMAFGGDFVGPYGYMNYQQVAKFTISDALSEILMPKWCAAGQLFVMSRHNAVPDLVETLIWDDGPPWRFELNWKKSRKADHWTIAGQVTRKLPDGLPEACPIKEMRQVLPGGLCLRDKTLSRMEPLSAEQIALLEHLRKDGEFVVPQDEIDPFIAGLSNLPHGTALALPAELQWETLSPVGVPRIQIKPAPKHASVKPDSLVAVVSFDYDGQEILFRDTKVTISDAGARRLLQRDREGEDRRWQELIAQGFFPAGRDLADDFDLQISAKNFSAAVIQLAAQGWRVEAEGAVIRRPGKINISISSGVDWFDLVADCDFDGVKATLPALLAAVERGQKFVELGDGSKGMLPDEWLAKYAPLAEMGVAKGDALRFLPSQAIILDALLAAQPDATHDKKFAEVRNRLQNFGGVKPAHEIGDFHGTLRDYQRDGLGWLQFLEEFSFGGCLADDMGLGKTVQVLAMLERRRVENAEIVATNGSSKRNRKKTESQRTLVVAPKSLVFNWLDEAKRFAPQLKTFDYTGLARKESPEALASADLVVTTYGTLRQDILTLRETEFHQVILDEAQAIKNPASQSAKACRLIPARHRLAMTGTPVENCLGDLWSIFEFLNPGMLGRSSNIRLFSGRTLPDKESLELLSRALRPFILRRTKEQVLKELPAKTEQTLFCEMDDQQRKLYNELRDHYRALLTQKIKDTGLARSKIQVLEALLRLRQAACHPGLLDKKKADIPSAKFDALLAQLEEVVAEKHKVLVFSQFTSLLALVKKQLDQRNITYEYLDGKTSNRKEKVDRFQNDPECPVFLISLKAGGHGLNLTAADYVYILDPWWNPAVEAQAVDRAHRLGQDKPVFVYRLIASGTVEEKILELQGQKRDLADAIISGDGSLLRNLSADDLQLLLS